MFAVHGFADLWGIFTTDRLLKNFPQEWEKIEQDYGFSLLPNLLHNDREARKMTRRVRRGAVAICHSNGSLVVQKAINLGADFRLVFWIHPALPQRGIVLPDAFRGQILVYWSRKDWVGHFGRVAGKLLPWVHWGDMMRVGYRGQDQRILNMPDMGDWHLSPFMGHRLRWFQHEVWQQTRRAFRLTG